MVAQIILNKVSKRRKSNITGFVLQTFFQVIRRIYLSLNKNALVKYNLENVNIILPLKHDLPLMKRNYSAYDTHIARIPKYIKEKYNDFQSIDIGANVGDSAIIIKSKVDIPILCIEPDDYYYSLLKLNTKNINGISYENCFVGESETSDLTLVQFKGTARLTSDEREESEIRFYSIQEIVEKHVSFNKVKFLKIDTDGFDCKIIRSNLDYIQQDKPVIFFEYDPYLLSILNDDGLSVFNLLKKNGYDGVLIYENTGNYLLSLKLDQTKSLEELHTYFSGWNSTRYMDICVFHNNDMDIFETTRNKEMDFFKHLNNKDQIVI